MTFWSYLNIWFLGVFGVIIEFLKFSKMSFLIFVNSDYFLNFFHLRPLYMTFYCSSIFLSLGVLGSFLSFWNFWKYIFLIFFILFIVCFLNFFHLMPLSMTFWIFWIFGCFGVIFEFLKFLKLSFLIFFNSVYSLFSELFWF